MQNQIISYEVLLGQLDQPQGRSPAVVLAASDVHPNVPEALHGFVAPLRRNGTVSFRPAKVATEANSGRLQVTVNGHTQEFTTLGTLLTMDDKPQGLTEVAQALGQTANKIREAGDLRALVVQQVTAAVLRHYPKAGITTDADDRVLITSDTSMPASEAASQSVGKPAGKPAPRRRGRASGAKVWL